MTARETSSPPTASVSLQPLATHSHDLVGPFPAGQRPESYDQLRRRVLWALPSGLYLLGSRDGERRNFMTTSWVTQLARDPKLLGAAVERDALTAELVHLGGCFTISLLRREDRAQVRHFVRPAAHDAGAHTLAGMPYTDAHESGAPLPAVAAAYVDCTLYREVDLGSHLLFIGQVVDAAFAPGAEEGLEVLRMEDTRMSYGG